MLMKHLGGIDAACRRDTRERERHKADHRAVAHTCDGARFNRAQQPVDLPGFKIGA